MCADAIAKMSQRCPVQIVMINTFEMLFISFLLDSITRPTICCCKDCRCLMVWVGMLSPGLPVILLDVCGIPVGFVRSVIWNAARFGPRTNPLPPLRCWPSAAVEATWSPSALLCRQHTGLRVFRCWRIARASVNLHWWSFLLGDVQSAAI